MDSSLTWDSVHFKEMSFAMNILSEDLIAADFPTGFFLDVKYHLPSIQAALQVNFSLYKCNAYLGSVKFRMIKTQ